MLAAIGVIALVASFFIDASICLVYNVFGIPCFSCGMTRAFRSLPDLRMAFFYHPLFFVVPFIPLLAILGERWRNYISVVLIILFIGLWLLRMVLLFPDQAPMEFNEASLVRRIMDGRSF